MASKFSFGGVAGWGATFALIVSVLNVLAPERTTSAAAQAVDMARAAPNERPTSDSARANPRSRATSGAELLHRFLGESAPATLPPAARYKLGILFVTVPDPLDSHLDWAYDAQLNAVRRALERDSYVIDLFWVPWKASHGNAATPGSEDTLHATHPGVLLFRRSAPNDRRLRLVYLIGEIPTSGVHKTALLTALHEADSLRESTTQFLPDSTMGSDIRIVGPVFSGAAPSLRLTLDEWQHIRGWRGRPVHILTGSASNTQNKTILEHANMTFAATVHDDSTLARFQTEVLLNRMRIRPRETAILRETSTQYGQLVDTKKTPLDSTAVMIPFPMHISELRAEYARNPDQLILGPVFPGGGSNVRLPLHLDEKPRLADGPPVLSDLTPPAVDAMIDDIARTLNAHHVRAVGILATDTRDVIFLATEVRKRVRDVLLFTYGSNTLYARPDVSEWLRGMLVVSTYPVTVESQFWDITQVDRQRVSFSGDMAEGVYNAVLMQLGDSASAAVVDYAHPLSLDTLARPPVWVTTVGRNSMLPVTALRDTPSRDPGSSRPLITPNVNYTIARHVLRRPDTITSLIRGQEGRGTPLDIMVFAALTGLAFAWLLRDQLITTYDERRAEREDSAANGSPAIWMGRAAVKRRLDQQLERFHEASAKEDWNKWPALNRLAQVASLRAQQEMYIILRVASLTVAAIGVLFLLFRTRAHASATWYVTLAVVVLPIGVGLYVTVWSVWRLRTVLLQTKKVRKAYVESVEWRSPVAKMMWQAETAGRVVAFVIGVGCLVAAIVLVVNVAFFDAVAARSFFYRSTAITAGVSPAIPLVVAGTLFYAWSVWNGKRIALLFETTAFEQLFFDQPSRKTKSDQLIAEIHAPGPRPASPAAGIVAIDSAGATESTADAVAVANQPSRVSKGALVDALPTNLTPLPSIGSEPINRMITESSTIPERIRQVRVRLFLSVPGEAGIVILGSLIFLAMWAWTQFNTSMEAVLLPTVLGLTSFDLLLRVSVLAAIGATIFGVYRLVGTWVALRDTLRALADTPLVYAFERLPTTVTRLTRLSPIDQPSDSLIDATLARKWKELQSIDCGDAITRLRLCAPDHLETSAPSQESTDLPPPRSASFLDVPTRSRLREFYADLETAWTIWPDVDPAAGSHWERGRSLETGTSEKKIQGGAEAKRDVSRPLSPKETWSRTASQCGAIYAIEYVEWVLHHLRNLAGFLMLSVILVTILLASYSFQPESALKAIFFGVSLVTVSGLVFVLLQMNRNDILSLITRTDPGRLSWDGAFTLNLALYIAIPLITLLSSEVPEVRNFLFAWVNPLLRALGKG